MYGCGDNEQLIASAAKNAFSRGLNASAEYVQSACEASLKRLNIDIIDLYYMHRVDPQAAIEETVDAMANLIKQGKISHIGLSEVNLEQLKVAHAVHPITAVKIEYSMLTRHVETNGVLQFCKENNIGFVAYSPLSRALLSQNLNSLEKFDADDFRRKMPRFNSESLNKNQEIVAKFTAIADRKKITLPQLSLAWLMSQGENIVPIPGTKRLKYLTENSQASEISLSNKDILDINAILNTVKTNGLRYTPEAIKTYQLKE